MTLRPARHLAVLARTLPIALAIVVMVACARPASTPPVASTASPEARAGLQSVAPASVVPATPRPNPPPSAPPEPTPRADPSPATAAVHPPPRPGRFHMDLYRRGDFVTQATIEWCVPASILTMANVIAEGRARGHPGQRRLDRISRSLSSPRLVGPGSEPEGWAGTLDRLGYGPYAVVAKATRQEALRAAARAIRHTGRPVGLLVWRGAHAWVMTGFAATADPAWTDRFRVTRVVVSDPWYPRSTAAWGRTRPPDSGVGVADLAGVYRPWRRPLARYAELDGRFVLVLPTTHRRGR